jgi:hypothetical protein
MLYKFKDPNVATAVIPVSGRAPLAHDCQGIVVRKGRISLKGSWVRASAATARFEMFDCNGRRILKNNYYRLSPKQYPAWRRPPSIYSISPVQ